MRSHFFKTCFFSVSFILSSLPISIFLFSVSFAYSTSYNINQNYTDKETKKKWHDIFDITGNLCVILQTTRGDGVHETQASSKVRFRIVTHFIPEKLDLILRIQNAAGEYFLGPGQLYPANNVSVDKPTSNVIPRGNALLDYAYLCWKPSKQWEFALGIFESWTYDMDTKEGIGGWLNGVDDCGAYLYNLHFFSMGGFKPSLSTLFRSLPTFAIRYDPFETIRLRSFALTTQVKKFGLFNPEWKLSKHTPDYNCYFFELEYRGRLFGKESSYRVDFGWVDTNKIPGLPDPEHYGFNWGVHFSQRIFSDHFSLNAFYYFSDGMTANKWVNYIKEEEVIVFTVAWGGNDLPNGRFYNYLCKHLLHVGFGKVHIYKGSIIPLDFRHLKAMTPIVKDEYVFEILYLQRMREDFTCSVGFQIIKNPGAGHKDWMFIPEIGVSIHF